MAKGIAEINVSDSDELRLKKINENFKNLVTGKTPVGAISTSGGTYSSLAGTIGTSLGGSARFANQISTYMIDAQYITAKKIGVTDLLADYAQMNFANIGEASIVNLWAKQLQADTLAASKADIANTLKAVTIQGDWIVANTISAKKLMLSSGDITDLDQFVSSTVGLFKMINSSLFPDDAAFKERVESMIPVPDTDPSYEEEKNKVIATFDTHIDGTAIAVGTLTAEHIVVDDLIAFGADIAGFKFIPLDQGGGLHAQVGSAVTELKPNGYFRVGSTNTYISVDPSNSELDVHCSTLKAEEDITHNDIWKWDLTPSGALNLLYIGA